MGIQVQTAVTKEYKRLMCRKYVPQAIWVPFHYLFQSSEPFLEIHNWIYGYSKVQHITGYS